MESSRMFDDAGGRIAESCSLFDRLKIDAALAPARYEIG
jgi:hypothetical protein